MKSETIVSVADKRVAISICVSEGAECLRLVLTPKDASAPPTDRFTDDNGASFRYRVFLSPESRIERDPRVIAVLRKAVHEWRRQHSGR